MNCGGRQLTLQTGSLVAGFMVWVILSSLMPFISVDIPLSTGQMAWVTAVPVILGSLLRVPIGFWTNRFGARFLFFISFLVLIVPIYYISIANTLVDLIIGGLFIGVGGAIFSIGVTSLPKYYEKGKHGFINGVYGMGNIGTAITSFAAPVLANQFGWRKTVLFYVILMLLFALLNFVLGDRKEPKVNVSMVEQIGSVYKSSKLWFLSLFYFITFGSFVAFTIYLPNFLVDHFALEKVDAGLRTAGFIVLATLLRPVGGWLGDKFNSFKILAIVFAGLTFAGFLLSFTPSLAIYTIGCLGVAICAGIGNGTIFKLVPLYFSQQAGIVNGIVAMMGGLGGFFPPLILTTLFSMTGHYAIGFMALSEFSLASLILVLWMYHQDRLYIADNVLENTASGMMLTTTDGKIIRVNPAFTEVTGYSSEEAIGQTPKILHSGKHGEEFYQAMWERIQERGYWSGEIWNKRKNGEVYKESLTISSVKNEVGDTEYYAGMFNELTNR
ncbi:NNP family nitrate/nitrite transporter-like MFS transporter [Lederbergia galactosidilyticus]|uniref:nitrate/nitrite transporter n=1 Tax=Lederbergia galactosidilytica TaxID=217031 RepID=UPI001AE25016|nr:nitrate/nitrite transporter [Lederbergia galactosidilytica]MBP1913853.1 NNP family nitrate/nitrite transporter-like MFS transporter [Lederbergia galactosidilytica]